MIVGNTYRITKRVKIHTKPTVKVTIVQEGVYIRETPKNYIFDSFWVAKSVVIEVEELEV